MAHFFRENFPLIAIFFMELQKTNNIVSDSFILGQKKPENAARFAQKAAPFRNNQRKNWMNNFLKRICTRIT